MASYAAEGAGETDKDSKDKNKDKDKKYTGCGPQSKCDLSIATVILGVIILYVDSSWAILLSICPHGSSP